ncbi:MAG: hypothetical protein L3J65_00185 [Robiginitomaculum sp.]|nr:hypothetical protein [Robiginitomaculum sp.]
MMRLLKYGLMFGNLVEVASPALVGRYNRALMHLIGKETTLTEFHIDISGYSPEIGSEFGDDLYLNPNGCNRQFILLTTDQKTAPLLNAQFSTSRSILRNFIRENEEELFVLTAREAVAGEMMNSVYAVTSPADLFQINKVDIEADTIQSHIAEAKTLQGYIDEFMSGDDAWWDDVLIAKMIELAKRTGNIQRNPIKLKAKSYSQGNYFTEHFGGIYVFRDMQTPTVIAREYSEALKDLPVDNILTFEDRSGIAQFFNTQGLAEQIVSSGNNTAAAIIKQKIDFVIISTAASLGDDLGDLTRQQVRQVGRKYAEQMPPEFHGLMQIWRWAKLDGAAPNLNSEHPAFFYALRAAQHADRDLVNMLLAELSPLDFRQLFICHKTAFYDAYRNWSEAKRDYVARFLAEEYAIDKAGARETLFGPEPAMDEEEVYEGPWSPLGKYKA